MKLKPGCGYYETAQYPIGGCFRRAGENGLDIVEVSREFPICHGCNREGLTATGARVAFNISNTERTAMEWSFEVGLDDKAETHEMPTSEDIEYKP